MNCKLCQMCIVPMFKLSFDTTRVNFLFLLFLKDEDPALRELAELESEGCLQDIQDLRQQVELFYFHKVTMR